jgi:hypothetical protein
MATPPISNAPWDGSPTQWKDTESYCAACLIDSNPAGKPKVQALCKLPYRFPSGAISSVSVHMCAAALAGARGGLKGVSPADKKSAAKKLLALYQQLKETPPPTLKSMAQ